LQEKKEGEQGVFPADEGDHRQGLLACKTVKGWQA
jgi:hypothetical protein